MAETSAESERFSYKVVCTWCGSIIRHNNSKDSRGMCLKCYARMLSEHNSAYQQRDRRLNASDR
jgi:hypothetical protein